MASETLIQSLLLRLEAASSLRRIRLAALFVAIIAVTVFSLIRFRGLSTPEGMDQAQIAREIARGNGFTTKMIRPLEYWELQHEGRAFTPAALPDLYHAPLGPYINSVFLRLVRSSWQMTPNLNLSNDSSIAGGNPCDRMIAHVAIGFFLLSVWVNYLIARRLFDSHLALLAAGLVLVCNRFWEFALSGLPQMLMLLLFSGAAYTLLRAIEARDAPGRSWQWAAAAGALFGMLALTHALTIWIFLGALIYVSIAFRPRGRLALVMLGVFSVFYAPWLIRNYVVCGEPFGLGFYGFLRDVVKSESAIMRSLTFDMEGVGPVTFHTKLQAQALFQIARMNGLLGSSLVAPLFLACLVHKFKRQETAAFQRCALCMILAGAFGMALFGLDTKVEVQASDLGVLFIPVTIFYGLAFLLVLLHRRMEVPNRVLQVGFICLVYLISAFPLLNALIQEQGFFNWPPYVPPVIAYLREWTGPDEVIASDMPWAVAWYADRKSLWLPTMYQELENLNDFNKLGGPIVGLFLTPVSGNAGFRSDIVDGDYRDWRAFIMGVANVKNGPFHAATALPFNHQCLYYSDRKRW